MNLGAATVIRANARNLPLADNSVDLVVTSPPYFALRSYQDGGEHYAGQIGDESTPAEFVASLLEVTAECVRVLKPSGSLWVNLGDKYAQAEERSRNGNGNRKAIDNFASGAVLGKSCNRCGADAPQNPCPYSDVPCEPRFTREKTVTLGRKDNGGVRQKSLIGIPWRYALACIDDLGLILRAEVIWCLSGGARVYARTSTGDRPLMLRDLVRAYRPEEVKLWNGEQWTQVLGWNKTPDDDGALELELRTGERVGCTPGHRWPTQRGVVRADEIRVGDVIQTTPLPEPDEPRNPLYLPDEDIGWLVGLYIAEGSRSGKTLQFAGHVNETMRHARLRLIARDLDGKANVYQTSENGATCNLTGAAILGVIDRYVTTGTAKTKRLRAVAWQRSDQFLRAVMDGYLSGDGHFDAKNDRWRLGFTANDEWAADMRTLAARTGAKLSLRRATHTAFGRAFPGWRGEWRWTRSAHPNAKPDGEVVAIRRSRARDFYDLGVADEPHLFALASGVLTHNSKPNGLPESVTDRVRRSHEQWFHFTLEPRYFSAVDEIREQYAPETTNRYAYGFRPASAVAAGQSANGPTRADGGVPSSTNPLGKLPGSVWTDTDPGDSLVRSVLSAVSAGALTIEEGERLLWTGTTNYGPRSTNANRSTAGRGSALSTDTDTGDTGAPARATAEPIDSSTRARSGRSRAASPSTTCVATAGASTPHTSSPSPSARTADDGPGHSAAQPVTPTTSRTHTSEPTASESADDAWPTESGNDELGPPSVWQIATEPLRVPDHLGIDHFAAFPTEWPKRIIQGWSPAGVCVGCGEGRRPVTSDPEKIGGRVRGEVDAMALGVSEAGGHGFTAIGARSQYTTTRRVTGYACACPEPTADTTPAVVIDPFGGTGTTAMVAKALGRHGISVDMSADYCRLAEWRTNDRNQLAKVLGVAKAEQHDDTHDSLLDLIDGGAA